MSDPRFRGPLDPPLNTDADRKSASRDPVRSNTMWGWIAGGILVALVLMFVFARAPSTSETASDSMNAPQPGQSTLAPTPAPVTPPTTTGSGQQ